MNVVVEEPPGRTMTELARLCVEHLRTEDAFWAQVLAALRALQQALSSGQWTTLAAAELLQQGLVQESANLHGARQSLRATLAAALQTPLSEVSLDRVVERLPAAERQLVLELRGRLRGQAHEVRRLTQACTLFANHHLQFIQRFFAELAGVGEGARYGPTGTLHAAACGPLLQARG
jgi:hypothetical protein